MLARFGQSSQRAGGAVDLGPVAPVRRECAAQHALLIHGARQILLDEPVTNPGAIGQVEPGLYFAALGTRSQRVARCLGSQSRCQCLYQRRFAGPGFSGDGHRAGGKIQVQLLNQLEVADDESGKHATGLKRGLNAPILGIERQQKRNSVNEKNGDPAGNSAQSGPSDTPTQETVADPVAQGNPQPAQQQSAEPDADVQNPQEELTRRVAELEDQLLRAQAEVQNTRRIAGRDMQQTIRRNLEEFAEALLPGLDGLELALQAFGQSDARSDPGVNSLAEGVRLTLSELESALQRTVQMSPIQPLGQPFDPQRHQAIGPSSAGNLDQQLVFQVHRRGWMLGDRVLRQASVLLGQPEQAKQQEDQSLSNDKGANDS